MRALAKGRRHAPRHRRPVIAHAQAMRRAAIGGARVYDAAASKEVGG